MADDVARSPFRLCGRDGNICCYEDALSTIFFAFLLLCLVSYFSFFVFLFFLFLLFSCVLKRLGFAVSLSVTTEFVSL